MNIAIAVCEPVGSVERGVLNYMAQEIKKLHRQDTEEYVVVYLPPKVSNQQALAAYLQRQMVKTEKAWDTQFDTMFLLQMDNQSEEMEISVTANAVDMESADVFKGLETVLPVKVTVGLEEEPMIKDDLLPCFRLEFKQNSFDGKSFTRKDLNKIYEFILKNDEDFC